MKPVDSGGHAAYQKLVTSQLKKYFPNRSLIPRRYQIIAERFYELDLSKVNSIMKDYYSHFGPRPRLPSDMFRSCLLMIELGIPSITKWCAHLKTDPFCAIISGFVVGDSPGIGTFYDFTSRLWHSDKNDFNDHVHMPPPKVKAPAGKGNKAASIEKTTVKDLLCHYQSEQVKTDAPYKMLFQIFDQIFLKESISRGLIDPEHMILAGDGTPIQTSTFERSRSLNPYEKDDPYHPDPDKKRYYSQPDCDIGWDSSRQKYYFGYSLYMLTDASSGKDLPVFPLLGKASQHDSLGFARTWFRMLAYKPDLHVDEVLLDSAHDALPYYYYFQDNGIRAFIDLKKGRIGQVVYHNTFTIGTDGVPICQAGLKMVRDGYDKTKGNTKYRCPYARASDGISSRCSHPCSSSDYGRVVKLPSRKNPRLFCIPARDSREWKKEYAKRTASERSNKREMVDMHIESGRHRSSRMWYCRLYFIIMCQHLDAWDLPNRFRIDEDLMSPDTL